ncbi:MAG: glutamate--tRNA ligase [Bacteroidetes bacterium]|nr:glutamate--tRNA ligase [bacterium]NBP65090.1 glutamate--tRNA ligase [Bacteroidota bacterium]
MSVRVRFAPSPTGFLHIGGLRTALYNYLFAKHHGGECILRIEDTDQTRFVEGAEDNIVEICRWAGMEFDESPEKGGAFGPYRQSDRTELYRKYANQLLESGNAYRAFDTSEELDAMRERQKNAGIAAKYDRTVMRSEYTLGPEETQRLLDSGADYCIRLKVPVSGDIRFNDIVRGEVIVNARDVDDQILLKSDGFPTYHLANVVDDHLMEITHVIRGEEWLPSTPKHVLLYQAFSWDMPRFAHLPLLLNPDKSKMSKRFGDVFAKSFREKGFFPDALINFVALLGWNPTSDREIFSMQELIDAFSLEKVNKAGAVFDTKKLEWMNAQYLRSTEPLHLIPALQIILKEHSIEVTDERAAKILKLLRERITFLNEVPTFGAYMFSDSYEIDEEYKAKHWNAETAGVINAVLPLLKELNAFDHITINDAVGAYSKEHGIASKLIIHPLRMMLTGKQVGAGLYETMEVLGKDACIQRIERFLQTQG